MTQTGGIDGAEETLMGLSAEDRRRVVGDFRRYRDRCIEKGKEELLAAILTTDLYDEVADLEEDGWSFRGDIVEWLLPRQVVLDPDFLFRVKREVLGLLGDDGLLRLAEIVPTANHATFLFQLAAEAGRYAVCVHMIVGRGGAPLCKILERRDLLPLLARAGPEGCAEVCRAITRNRRELFARASRAVFGRIPVSIRMSDADGPLKMLLALLVVWRGFVGPRFFVQNEDWGILEAGLFLFRRMGRPRDDQRLGELLLRRGLQTGDGYDLACAGGIVKDARSVEHPSMSFYFTEQSRGGMVGRSRRLISRTPAHLLHLLVPPVLALPPRTRDRILGRFDPDVLRRGRELAERRLPPSVCAIDRRRDDTEAVNR